MSHGAPQHMNVITVTQGGRPVVALTITGMHHPPQPSAGNPVTHWYGSTNTFQVTAPGVLAASPNVTVTHGTSSAHTQGPHPPRFVQASGRTYNTPRTTPQPTVSVASGRGRSAPSAFSSPPTTAPPSAYPPSHRPRPRPRQPPTAPSNPSYRGSSSDNQDRADSRGFHYAEGTNGRPQAGHARDSVDPRVAPRAPPVDADRPGRYLVGAEYIAGGGPIARKYLDSAWGVTPGTKNMLGLTD